MKKILAGNGKKEKVVIWGGGSMCVIPEFALFV